LVVSKDDRGRGRGCRDSEERNRVSYNGKLENIVVWRRVNRLFFKKGDGTRRGKNRKRGDWWFNVRLIWGT